MDECGMKNINKVVLKFGGSVLYGKADFERISREINRYVLKNYQVVAVVSAYYGVTEKLFDKAARLKTIPSSAAFAEIVASGEFESALELVSYLIHNGHKACLRTLRNLVFWPLVSAIQQGRFQSARNGSIPR